MPEMSITVNSMLSYSPPLHRERGGVHMSEQTLTPRHAVAGFKRTVAWDSFIAHCILSSIERKGLNFFHVVSIFTELGEGLTHLAHNENTQSDNFLWDRRKFFMAFCFLWALVLYPVSHGWNIGLMEGVLISCWKIFAHSLNTLNAAIVRRNKKIIILTLYPGYDGMVKKIISRYCPFHSHKNDSEFRIWHNTCHYTGEIKT